VVSTCELEVHQTSVGGASRDWLNGDDVWARVQNETKFVSVNLTTVRRDRLPWLPAKFSAGPGLGHLVRLSWGQFTVLIAGASGPQPHPGSIELFCSAPFSGGDGEVERAGEDASVAIFASVWQCQ
jgi:hypothetical protein